MIYQAKCFNENGTVNHDELKKLLDKVVNELERRYDIRKHDEFEYNVQVLTLACSALWSEKEGWREEYMKLADRYINYLDKLNEDLREML